MPDSYDVIVIGGGPGGEVVAGRCARGGLSTIVVENDHVGGECSFWACMPSKTMLRPSEVLAAARRVPGAREAITGGVDVGAALARRDVVVKHWDDSGQVGWLEGVGVDLVRGTARLAGTKQVEVRTSTGSVRRLSARRGVVIATGSAPFMPHIPGLDSIRPWDNRDATGSATVPRRLIVLGGGAVGVEMAQAWHSFGSEVTLIQGGERLLTREEPFVGETLRDAFEEQGIRVLTGTHVTSVGRVDDTGPVHAYLDDESQVFGDELLVALGRRPRTTDIGLGSVGVADGSLEVAHDLRVKGVGGDWLYAIGDASGQTQLTHMSKYHARIVGDRLLGDSEAVAEHRAIPRILFTDPQVAAVGLTEKKAVEGGIDIVTARADLWDVAGSTVSGEDVTGPVQIVVDRERGVLVGATFVGPGIGDLLHSATIAIVGEVPLERLRHAVPCFPSVSEVWLQVVENVLSAVGISP